MDYILETITQQAMNYAIRSGITISAGFAIRECTRLVKNTKSTERNDIAKLQRKLDGKIQIISPAIDMIELIAARGNTSLESAVSLTKAIRLDIETLGARLARAADEQEKTKRKQAHTDQELQLIIGDIKQLLERIEDAVPLINLAITTSGVNLSTQLPSTVSPSRLLQASTFLSAGDSRYNMTPDSVVQIGPTFTLSLYMLFAGHSMRPQDVEGVRETTWKEVIHKARVKLLRVPLDEIDRLPCPANANRDQEKTHDYGSRIPSLGAAYEFAYQLLIVEDLDDGRVHVSDESEPQPASFDDVQSAGIREIVPIHQVSKIFYADTGRILGIGSEGNHPVLLLKRDISATAPRQKFTDEMRMSGSSGTDSNDDRHTDEDEELGQVEELDTEEVDAQIRRESSAFSQALDGTTEFAGHFESQSGGAGPAKHGAHDTKRQWTFPPDLDPEWIALEVYVEDEASSDEEDGEQGDGLRSCDHQSDSTPPSASRQDITEALANLQIKTRDSSPPQSPGRLTMASPSPVSSAKARQKAIAPQALLPIRTSLSLLELLIRLTALQQFQQASHLTITDELLNFFLSEASTTGAGADGEYRRKVRREARRRVGFDPYDESPIKLHGEDYVRRQAQYYEDEDLERIASEAGDTPQSLNEGYHRGGSSCLIRETPYYASSRYASESPAPSSLSPSIRKLTSLHGPRKGHRTASPTPAQIRLAPTIHQEEAAAAEKLGEISNDLTADVASARKSYDSTLGLSPDAKTGFKDMRNAEDH